MSLKSAYDAELQKQREAVLARDASRREGVERLRVFYESIMAEDLPEPNTEVEFADEELMIDPGPIMITVRVNGGGQFRLFYEVKSPDAYNEIEVPDVDGVEALENAIARLLVEYRA